MAVGRSVMVPVFVIALCIVSSVTALNEIKQLDLHSGRVLLQNVGRMFGFPRLSGELFSQVETKEVFENEISDDELKITKYQDPCSHDLVKVAFSIREQWALSMLDSDGKLPSGVLNGNHVWPGSYSECLAVQAPSDPTDNQTGFSGRYCTLSWEVEKLNLPITVGLCVPDTCQDADFVNMTKLKLLQKTRSILPKLSLLQNSTLPKLSWFPDSRIVKLTSISCQSKMPEYDAGAITVLGILQMCLFAVSAGTTITVIVFLFPSLLRKELSNSTNILSTEINSENPIRDNTDEDTELTADGCDMTNLVSKTDSPAINCSLREFLQCFCVIKNGAKILDTSDKGGTELRCIHGIRFLSMAWVILGHTYGFAASVSGNLLDLLKAFDTFSFQLVMQGSYAVDSFFVMSGFLLTHLFFRELNSRGGKVSWIAFYLHRYWRLTPVYAVLMAFDTKLTPYLISGPFRPAVYESGCEKTWWWNLLYINNFAPSEDSCMAWSWYLANDMQFYVISPLFLYTLWRWPKIGLGVIFSLICGSWITSFVISYHYDILDVFTNLPRFTDIAAYVQNMQLYMNKLYIKPYTHIGPYLIGVLLAYVFSKTEGRQNFLTKNSSLEHQQVSACELFNEPSLIWAFEAEGLLVYHC